MLLGKVVTEDSDVGFRAAQQATTLRSLCVDHRIYENEFHR
jgi:hypothetical protein